MAPKKPTTAKKTTKEPAGDYRPAGNFKKAKSPPMGEAFGSTWGKVDGNQLILPNGGALAFDFTKLTLSDYREMLNNYQIKSSLESLNFIMHQSAWTIECESEKIKNHVTENLERVWTQLNSAMSTAHWAGYSPSILQWENDTGDKTIQLAKIKDLVPESATVNWKEVDGWAPPGQTPPKHKIYDGIREFGSRWPVPSENCVHPDTLMLTAELEWKRAGDLVVGEKIVSFDEKAPWEKGEKGNFRRYRTAEIVVNRPGSKPSVSISTDIGDPITASTDHPFLVRRKGGPTGPSEAYDFDYKTCPNCGAEFDQPGISTRKRKYCSESCEQKFNRERRRDLNRQYNDHWVWVDAKDLKPGDAIAYFGDVWETQDSYDAGYLAGIFDGEGSLSMTQGRSQLSIYQNPGAVLDETKRILEDHGFDYLEFDQAPNGCTNIVIRGGRREVMRFIGMFSPVRHFDRGHVERVWDGYSVKSGDSVDVAIVQTVDEVGDSPIASIQTSTGTFITQGYLSHNTLFYPFRMQNGNYAGTKLLQSAYIPFYFSNLIHLFNSRYLERFGEPAMVGRAPMGEEVELGGGETQDAGEFMLRQMSLLRNGAVSMLPNEKDGTGKDASFEYQIEYLESQVRGADFERYLTRLDEEMSLALFTPLLLMRTGDSGSYNQSSTHMQMFLWGLNALNGDRKPYIDKFIINRMVDFNFGPNAPRAQIVFRKMGNDNAELVKTVATQMVNGKIAKVNLRELSDAAGLEFLEMTEEEAKTVAERENGGAQAVPGEDGDDGVSVGKSNDPNPGSNPDNPDPGAGKRKRTKKAKPSATA